MSLKSPAARRSIVRVLTKANGPICCYCRVDLTDPPAVGPFPPTLRTIDHLIPRSRGGTSRIANLVLACTACNTAKGDLLPLDFIARRIAPCT